MKQKIYFLALIAFLCSCSPAKQIFQGGRLSETNFITKIPFNFDYDIPIITVEIEGKSYRFLFDTGAPTVLSPEIAALLKLKVHTDGTASDSQGNSSARQFVVIPNMKIGNLNFENTGALVIDLKASFDFRCVNLDGLIGSNQMAKAIWEIDYQQKIITASNQLSNFDTNVASEVIAFVPKKDQLTPLVPIKIGGKTAYATFDSGSSGGFNLAVDHFNDEIADFKKVDAVGSSATGVYGSNKATLSSYVKVPTFNIGPVVLENQILEFQTNSSNTVGNSFIKNYKVVLNWAENKIYMLQQTPFKKTKLTQFGAIIKFASSKPTIAKIYKNSDAEKLGLLVNDEVIAINGKDTANFSDSQGCYYLLNYILDGMDTAVITVLRGGKKVDFSLKKTLWLE